MKLIIEKTETDISKVAADLLFGKMLVNRRMNLAITAGSTPKKTYQFLAEKVIDRPYLNQVHYYNFDEVPFSHQEASDGVTMKCLRELYFTPAAISETQIHALTAANYQAHDAKIAADGGLDAIFLGVGADGHFCGNLPQTTQFHNQTVVVDTSSRPDMADILKNEMLKAGVSEDLACDFYVTMGPKSVMTARELILMATGKNKAKIIKAILFGEVNQEIPASILQLHPNLTVLLDEAAASEIQTDL